MSKSKLTQEEKQQFQQIIATNYSSLITLDKKKLSESILNLIKFKNARKNILSKSS